MIKIAVIGSGVIGSSWAALFLAYGHEVVVYDPAPDTEKTTRAYIKNAWKQLEALGAVAEGASSESVAFASSIEEAVEGARFVQESVPERLPIKLETYRSIEPALAKDAVVATSASGLMIKDMQDAWQDPSRFLLGHPFNPPHLVPLVELLGGEHTSEDAIAWAAKFYESCGKTTIRVHKEVPAHVANRLQAALWREAIHLVDEGVVSVTDVDKAVVAGIGVRWATMGPNMLFALGSGGGGMTEFCARYGDSFQRWWDSLGKPTLDDEVVAKLSKELKQTEAGENFESLAKERDTRLIATIKALKDAS